jgi:ATP-dependent exoDNAse (exonuclease V) beta subunit
MPDVSIRIISAGAGTGKTHRLIVDLEQLMGGEGKLSPDRLLAVTFTRRAAAELRERLRQELYKTGCNQAADRLDTSLVGTVNSVCGSLLQLVAFEAGLAPSLNVVAEQDQQVLFNEAVAAVMDEGRVSVLEEIAERFGFGAGRNPHDWHKDLRDIIDAARSNGISAQILKSCAAKSLEGMVALLPPCWSQTEEELDWALKQAIERTIEEMRKVDDQTKGTREYADLLEETKHRLRHGASIPWGLWVKLTKAKPTKKSESIAESVRQAAFRHPSHPGLRRDIEVFVQTLFSFAADAIEYYQRYKRERGLVDFVDQESLLLNALDIPEVRKRFQDEFDLLIVDEVQDTSPVQLALFIKLADLAGHSIWVGDPKQSIYAFRGAAPSLMDAVIKELRGFGEDDILKTSYRARPELVRFVNAVFVPSLSQVALMPHRPNPAGATVPLRAWLLDGSNKEQRAGQIASGIVDLLAEAPVIFDEFSSCERKARAGDMALLCRTHDDSRDMANALVARGVKVAIARPGLATTPEGKLALACLRLYSNPSDTLARAEIKVLTSKDPKPEEWLQERLEYLQSGQPSGAWGNDHPVIAKILVLAQRAFIFSPVEALEEIIEAVDLRRLTMGWGNLERRLGNVERFRALTRDYEETCSQQAGAASIGGFLFWLQGLVKSEEDCQSEGNGPDAVNILTCHGAKGLEWPIVICANLDTNFKEKIWGLTVIDDRDGIDLAAPLAERWLRYWPWPYGAQCIGTGLREGLDGTPELNKATAETEAEELRLLYVTLTRARDYLVLCLNTKVNAWLDLALGKAGHSLTVPADATEIELEWDNEKEHLKMQVLRPQGSAIPDCERATTTWVADRKGRGQHPAAVLNPSTFQGSGPSMAGKPVLIGKRIKIKGKPVLESLGTALHDFIAADANGKKPETERILMLSGILLRHGLAGAVNPEVVIFNCDAFYRFISDRFKLIRILTEWPASMTIEDQYLTGNVDMILDTEEGWVVIDHKIFPGGKEDLRSEAAAYGGQLSAYSDILEKATGKKPVACLIHFIIAGAIVECR